MKKKAFSSQVAQYLRKQAEESANGDIGSSDVEQDQEGEIVEWVGEPLLNGHNRTYYEAFRYRGHLYKLHDCVLLRAGGIRASIHPHSRCWLFPIRTKP